MGIFFKKHKLAVDITFFVVSAAVSILNWYDFFENGKQWKLLGGVLFGIMAIVKLGEIIMQIRRKKNIPSHLD
jgi:hypothetical protein